MRIRRVAAQKRKQAEAKALHLWRRFFKDNGVKLVMDDRGGSYCFFCAEEDECEPDCIYDAAEALIKEADGDAGV